MLTKKNRHDARGPAAGAPENGESSSVNSHCTVCHRLVVDEADAVPQGRRLLGFCITWNVRAQSDSAKAGMTEAAGQHAAQ